MPCSPFFYYNASFDAQRIMHDYAVQDLEPDPNYLTNFLGVKIAPKYFPGILDGKEGVIEPIPIPANWHADIAEWAFALRSVDQAKSNFRIVELGCGWGCWLNNTGAAARRRGLDIELIGIEGDENHIGFAVESLTANGFVSREFQLIHGVASPRRGKALFPVVEKAGANWNSEPVFNATTAQISKAKRTGNYQILQCYTLSDLAAGKPVDLLHIDIQGGEAVFVRENFKDINAHTRRMLIGTHSRVIEGDIMEFMLAEGWILEMERPCIFGLANGHPQIMVDGVQGWLNPKTIR